SFQEQLEWFPLDFSAGPQTSGKEPLRNALLLTWYKLGRKSYRFLLLDKKFPFPYHFGKHTSPPPHGALEGPRPWTDISPPSPLLRSWPTGLTHSLGLSSLRFPALT
ncbi:hypothetical protein CRENBAI_012212, partial [Crenichthys baileyi]